MWAPYAQCYFTSKEYNLLLLRNLKNHTAVQEKSLRKRHYRSLTTHKNLRGIEAGQNKMSKITSNTDSSWPHSDSRGFQSLHGSELIRQHSTARLPVQCSTFISHEKSKIIAQICRAKKYNHLGQNRTPQWQKEVYCFLHPTKKALIPE
jgi:hypothetical protein